MCEIARELELLKTALDLCMKFSKVLFGRLSGGPADTKTLLLIWLGDDVDCSERDGTLNVRVDGRQKARAKGEVSGTTPTGQSDV